MCVCVCVCVCVLMIFIYMFIYIYIYSQSLLHIQIYKIYMCLFLCICLCVCLCCPFFFLFTLFTHAFSFSQASDQCESGKFGSDCQHECHCEDMTTCNNITGECGTGCAQGWDGPTCQRRKSSSSYLMFYATEKYFFKFHNLFSWV